MSVLTIDDHDPGCVLCTTPGGQPLAEDGHCRVVLVEGAEAAAFPGYCRVVWKHHVKEMSDLLPAEQQHVLNVVLTVERVLRRLYAPEKINLAALGNMTPHLHWHVIPRWRDDSHFPDAIWAPARRAVPPRAAPDAATLKAALRAEFLKG